MTRQRSHGVTRTPKVVFRLATESRYKLSAETYVSHQVLPRGVDAFSVLVSVRRSCERDLIVLRNTKLNYIYRKLR